MLRDRQTTNTLNRRVVALCPFSYALGYRTSPGSAKVSWNASISELQARREE